jgi:hypothetical protein
MWTVFLLLWSIPLMLGCVGLARASNGSAPLSAHERRLVFGRTQETRISIWMAVKFATLALVFFALGLLQGAVLLNFGVLWIMSAALLTGSAAIVMLALWVRSGPPVRPRVRRPIGSHRTVKALLQKLSGQNDLFRAWLRPPSKRRRHLRTRAAPVGRSDEPEF